jgi:pimeloyl-ACP methyl ester carboxylesterase
VVLTGTVPPRAPTAADSARDAADAAAAQAFRTRPAVQAELRRASVDGDPAVLAPKQQTEAWRIRYAAANLHHVERWRALKGGQVSYNARAGRVDWGGARHQAWTGGAPNATVVVLRDAGHSAWLDAPDPFRDALEAALARSAQCPAP